MVDIPLGTKCNNCCIMCTNIMPSRLKQPTTDEILSILRKLNKDVNVINLTGGEPTIREDFFEILEFIRKNLENTKIVLITNGRKFYYKSFCEKCVNFIDKVVTELHGEKELHDKITQSPGSFNQTFNGIKNLIKYGFDVELRIVIHKLNYKQLHKIAELYVENFPEVKKIVIFPIDIIGNANVNKDKLIVTYKEILPFVEKTIDFLNQNKINFELWHFPLCILKEYYRKFAMGRTVPEKRLARMDICNNCNLKEYCSKPWATYVYQIGNHEFKPNCD